MMTTRRDFLGATVALAAVPVAAASAWAETPGATGDAQWRRRLSADQFAVLRESGTERPFSSSLLKEKRSGTFACAGCARPLFSSDTKYDSHTGWPSFWAPLTGAVSEQSDNSLGMPRTAVSCSQCEGHLGHVFNDGPKPTGLRYCMNGVAMRFRPGAA